MSRENDLVGTSREEMIIGRDQLMARGRIVAHGAGYRPQDHDIRRPVRIAALERLRTEHGIVPRMPELQPVPESVAQPKPLITRPLDPGEKP